MSRAGGRIKVEWDEDSLAAARDLEATGRRVSQKNIAAGAGLLHQPRELNRTQPQNALVIWRLVAGSPPLLAPVVPKPPGPIVYRVTVQRGGSARSGE